MSTLTFTFGSYSTIAVTYTITNTATTTVVNVSKVTLTTSLSGGFANPYTNKSVITLTGQTGLTVGGSSSKGAKSWSKAISFSRTYTKTHSAQNGKVLRFDFSEWTAAHSESNPNGSGYGTVTFNVPVKTSYAVTYNANGGSGTMSSGTKWHDESYPVASNSFTRTNYTFNGWNTKADGTGTSYAAGASYTSNAATTLYAQWLQSYASPQLTVDKVYRCDSSGNNDDEGTYAAVEYSYQIWKTSSQNSATVTLDVNDGSAQHPSVTSDPFTASGTNNGWSGGAGKVFVYANLDPEKIYGVTVTITDTQGGTSGRSSASAMKSTQISTAFYLVDFLGDKYLYNLTQDSAIDSEKTYYTRSGSGTSTDPYSYSVVENPNVSNIGSYYEANGPRPGHGVTFCGVADREGINSRAPISVLAPFLGHDADSSGFIVQDPSNFPTDQGAAPSTNMYGDLLSMRQGDKCRVRIGAHALADGRQGMAIEQVRYNTSDTRITNTLGLWIAADGTRTVSVSDANAWLSALGLTVTYTTTVSNILSAASGVTITMANYAQFGKVANLHVQWKYNADIASGNITNITLGTIASGKRPKAYAPMTTAGGGPVMTAYINSSGSLILSATAGAISKNSEVNMCGTYILA